MTQPPFSFVITYRHSIDRLQNLRRVLDWASGFKGAEVLLIEQDRNTKINHLNLRAKHIFIKNTGSFNRSWGLNVGFKLSKSDIVIFSDADLIMPPNNLAESIKKLQDYPFVSPYNRVIDLDKNETNIPINDIFKIKRDDYRGKDDNQKINPCGGMTIFRRNDFMNIGMWNELFSGWGGEDTQLFMKIQKLQIPYIEMPYEIYHLYHNKANIIQQEYERNLGILSEYSKLNIEQINSDINISKFMSGRKNKFE